MKAIIATAATAALAGIAGASVHHGRHAHDLFHGLDKKGDVGGETCSCTTIYSTYYGEPTLVFPPPPPEPTTTSTSTLTSTTSTTVTTPSTTTTTPPPVYTTEPPVEAPTPVPHTCPTPGTYTFTGTTVTLTETTAVCVPTSMPVPSGTHTYGGVTTVVTTATTVTCPYPTVSTSNGVETSIVETTTYVCPSAGTYTIAPTTTVCPSETTVTYPVVTEYPPGTYTQTDVVTTVTDTNTVIFCPFEPSPTPEPTTYAPAPEPTTTYAPEPEPTTAPPQPTKPPGGNTPGMPYGATFTPYTPDGACMTEAQVEADIAKLAAAGIKVLRTYSTDCSTLEFVGNACRKHGMQMMVGVYIDQPGCSASEPSIEEQISAIKSWAQWDLVPMVVVGNEASLNGFCEPSQLAGLINHARESFTGFTGQFTTADTVNIWQQDDYLAAICPVIDVVGANAHAFFDLGTTADEAGPFVKSQLELVSNVCPGKEGIVLESGWPSQGNPMGLAVPGVAEQETAIKSIIETIGDKVVIFSMLNDAWKDPNTECACEPYFGCASVLGISLSW